MDLRKNEFYHLWYQLYDDKYDLVFGNFLDEVEDFCQKNIFVPNETEWYKDVCVYSLYVDLFNKDFSGLIEKLDYLSDLGISCLWLLPVLDSPMRDAGFDIKDYYKIRQNLLETKEEESIDTFDLFLVKAKERNIKVIFDIAINHTSEDHQWFQQAKNSIDSPYRDFYIWNKTADKYKDARIIFAGIEESNWKRINDEYYFHRFFDFQPDLNYRNPLVLIEIIRVFLFWIKKGIDGFRVDAVPYLWKEEGTECENLPETHLIIKIIRLILDYVNPSTLLLAEACQQPKEVVKYFGNEDECQAAYHFPLMPQIFKALGTASKLPVVNVLGKKITPEIPESCQWFSFLRCHDELSLELTYVSEEERKFIYDFYCKQANWDFRLGQGISARLSELLDRNPAKISLAFSVMFSLSGTPIVYYGDEFGKLNDENFYHENVKKHGKDDSRFLVRGKIDWENLKIELENNSSYSYLIFNTIKNMISKRSVYKTFGRGDLKFLNANDINNNVIESVLIFERNYQKETLLIIHNLSEIQQNIYFTSKIISREDILGNTINFEEKSKLLQIKAYGSYWLKRKIHYEE